MASSCVPGLRQRYQQGEERGGNNADLHHGLAAEAVGNRRGREHAKHEEENRRDREPTNLLGGQMQRLLGQHEQRAGERHVVALDEADNPEHQDDLYVIDAERNAVELSSEQKAGRIARADKRSVFHHGVLPDGQRAADISADLSDSLVRFGRPDCEPVHT